MRVVVTGSSGQLGAYLLDGLRAQGHTVIAWSCTKAGTLRGVPLRRVELTDQGETERALAESDPDVVLHAAAISAAEAVRGDPERGWAVNVHGTEHLARWCRAHGRRIVFTSTDLVFDGTRSWYREDDPAQPVLEYGRTKCAAEQAVLAVPGGVVARISLLFGPSRCGRPSFFDRTIEALRRGEPQTLFVDEFRTPLHLATAAAILVRLAESEVAGRIHVAGPERVSRFELIRCAASVLGLDPSLVRGNRQADADLPEPRPADVSLDTSRLEALWPDLRAPSLEEVLGWGLAGDPFAP